MSDAKRPAISVIVPVRNGELTIEQCLESILETDYPTPAREVIVVDNASTDRTPASVRRYPVTCVTEVERGPAPTRNRGIRASAGEIVAFTDADCVVTKGWLRELAVGLEDPAVSAVAGEIEPYRPTTAPQRYLARRLPRQQQAAMAAARPFFATGNLAFRREVFACVGMFDSRFITGEDQDFSWRFFAAGLIGRYAPNALVFHQHRRTGWGLFQQQLGWARGAVLLRRHHDLPWGLQAEIREYTKLALAIADLLAAAARYAARPGVSTDLSYRFYAVVRELAWRLGWIESWARGTSWRPGRRAQPASSAVVASRHRGRRVLADRP